MADHKSAIGLIISFDVLFIEMLFQMKIPCFCRWHHGMDRLASRFRLIKMTNENLFFFRIRNHVSHIERMLLLLPVCGRPYYILRRCALFLLSFDGDLCR